MHRSSRAPVLSATRRRDSCWIMALPRRLHDFGQAPVLLLRERTRLDDADEIAHLRLVLLVVRVELRRAADDLLVARVRLERVDLHHDRLVHRARDDDAAALLAAAALVVRLRQPDDRLARLGTLALRLRAGAALRAWEALALRLPLGLLRLRGRRRLGGGRRRPPGGLRLRPR